MGGGMIDGWRTWRHDGRFMMDGGMGGGTV